MFEREGYELLSKEYKNIGTPLRIRCPEGHEYDMYVNNFRLKGVRCRYCGGKEIYDLNDIVGKRFGRLTVKKYNGRYKKNKKSRKRHYYLCDCECGEKDKEVLRDSLVFDRDTSCGCFQEERRFTHSKSRTRLYKIHQHLLGRCNNPKNDAYYNYGGRGIKVCSEWSGENGFVNFYKWANNNGYKKTLTVDRINVNGNYEPSNCRWATRKEQQNNRRDNHMITIKGTTKTIAEWADESGLKYYTISNRVINLGWEGEKILKPVDKSKIHNCKNK